MSHPTLTAWDQDQRMVDEQEFTPWAKEGWPSWNGQSPEVDVVAFVEQLVQMMQPDLVLETGVGQGYMTRAIVETLTNDQHLLAYESDDRWRHTMWTLPYWIDHRNNVSLSSYPTPLAPTVAKADLCVFDSDWDVRFEEVRLWDTYAKPGSVAIIHDTSDQPQTIHQSLRSLIGELGMTGVFLKNPRGCFMAVQP